MLELKYLESFAPLLDKNQELRSQTNIVRTLVISGGNVLQNQRREESGIFSRAWHGGAFGACSLAGFDKQNVERVIKMAAENAKTIAKFKKDFKDIPKRAHGRVISNAPFTDPEQIELLDFSKELDAYIQSKYPKLTNRVIRVAIECTKTQLYSLDATSFERTLPRAHIYVTLMTKDKDGLPVSLNGKLGGGGSFCDYFTSISVFANELDKIYTQLMDKAEGVYSNAGVADVILSADMAGIFAHEAVGHTTESDNVRAGGIAAHNKGQKVAHEKVTLVDFAHSAFGQEAPMPIYVDDEGTPAEDVVIIKDGIMLDYMTNIQDAPYINTTPKGNGRAYSYSDEPLVRMRNTCILPGNDSFDDMIASIDNGYYLISNSNGQADSTSEFMFGITMGYEIKNGKLGAAIKDTTISGVAFDLLKTVDMVGKDISWAASGYCGKKTPLGNAMGGPTLKCRLQIGGR